MFAFVGPGIRIDFKSNGDQRQDKDDETQNYIDACGNVYLGCTGIPDKTTGTTSQ
jgi:hypothetical protein